MWRYTAKGPQFKADNPRPSLETMLRSIKTFEKYTPETASSGNWKGAAAFSSLHLKCLLLLSLHPQYLKHANSMPEIDVSIQKAFSAFSFYMQKWDESSKPPPLLPQMKPSSECSDNRSSVSTKEVRPHPPYPSTNSASVVASTLQTSTGTTKGDDIVTAELRARVRECKIDVTGKKHVLDFKEWAGSNKVKGTVRKAMNFKFSFSPTDLASRARHMLLYGPAGTGKTSLALMLAKEAGSSFFQLNLSEILSSRVGDNELFLKLLMEEAIADSPAIIFFDEIDGILGLSKEPTGWETKLVVAFKTCYNMIADSQVMVLMIGATNSPWKLKSEGILRRFPVKLLIDLPDYGERLQLLQNEIKRLHHTLQDDDLQVIATRLEGYSGSDIHDIFDGAIQIHELRTFDAVWFVPTKFRGETRWTPGSESDDGARFLTDACKLRTLLLYPPVNRETVLQEIESTVPDVKPQKAALFRKWNTSLWDEKELSEAGLDK